MRLELAKKYPFDVPDCSFFFINGKVVKIKKTILDPIEKSIVSINDSAISFKEFLESENMFSLLDFHDRISVLAYGSNASLYQLRRKFSGLGNSIIPVIKASLIDFDVVYSAHFSKYGSIPATLQFSPNTNVSIFVTYLTKEQLLQMHKTEGLGSNYFFAELNNVKLCLENGGLLTKIHSYLSMHGCLVINGKNIALSAIKAQNRIFTEMSEVDVLKLVKNLFNVRQGLDEFIQENIKNANVRSSRIKSLAGNSNKLRYTNFIRLGKNDTISGEANRE